MSNVTLESQSILKIWGFQDSNNDGAFTADEQAPTHTEAFSTLATISNDGEQATLSQEDVAGFVEYAFANKDRLKKDNLGHTAKGIALFTKLSQLKSQMIERDTRDLGLFEMHISDNKKLYSLAQSNDPIDQALYSTTVSAVEFINGGLETNENCQAPSQRTCDASTTLSTKIMGTNRPVYVGTEKTIPAMMSGIENMILIPETE